MRAQPSKGRYFPIGPSRLIALTRDWPLNSNAGAGPRRLRNPDDAELKSQALAYLRPGRDLTVYSLSNDIDPAWGEKAVTKALETLARWKAEPAEHVDGRSRFIAVYFNGQAQLRVLDERVIFTRRKFGAGEGLSSSRKPKATSRRIMELAIVDID
jgi:hypothetical protein